MRIIERLSPEQINNPERTPALILACALRHAYQKSVFTSGNASLYPFNSSTNAAIRGPVTSVSEDFDPTGTFPFPMQPRPAIEYP
jgi:hypothetical protein